MIRINLLPFRTARKKENVRRQVSIFMLTLALVAVGFLFYNMRLNGEIRQLTTDIDSTNMELVKYQKINKEIAEIKKKLAILQKKTEVIRTLVANRREPVELLDKMTEMVIAQRMWFTSLESSQNSVSVNGIAVDNKTVADFMTQLEDSKLFASVDLRMLQKQGIKQHPNLKSFQITCNKASAPKAETPAKGKKK